ncbi:hypothetical protein LSH36_528g01045 [Paralvinella palmiformis]|uniref:G-protein coupled receptors family 1 profile domain-containing protein n=1 Tax=Paralvinella palmiformis TaxID=53620 RepID=A0AAD9MWE0_9ANNE|nr:hypothetical protein LSH36_528g01045 [Paralvinella palmiformis]
MDCAFLSADASDVASFSRFDDYGGSPDLTSVNMTAGAFVGCATNVSFGNLSHPVMQLEPYSMAHLLGTAIILGLIILATIIGNVFVIAAVILEKNLHNVANYLIASLSIADLMVASLVMPLAAVNEVSKQWFLGPEICDMFISFDVFCCTSSILHLVAIALDRYWAVTQVDYIHNRSANRILIMIGLSWGISACISIPPLFGWKDQYNDPDVTGECLISQDWGYTVYSTVGAFYLPLLVIIIIYMKIFRAARNRIRRKRFKAAAAANSASNLDPATPKPLLDRRCQDGASTPPPQDGAGGGVVLQPISSSISQSPEASSNGSAVAFNDANRNNKPLTLMMTSTTTATPPPSPSMNHIGRMTTPSHKSSWVDLTKMYFENRKVGSPKAKKTREKLEQKRERKAARTLAIITGSFITCWLPFFILALVRPFCGQRCVYPLALTSIIGWLGYFNSLLNPIIYTIFNPDFRSAFRKILFGKYHHNSRYSGHTRRAPVPWRRGNDVGAQHPDAKAETVRHTSVTMRDHEKWPLYFSGKEDAADGGPWNSRARVRSSDIGH